MQWSNDSYIRYDRYANHMLEWTHQLMFPFLCLENKGISLKMFLVNWDSFLSKIYLRLILNLMRIFKWRVRWVAIEMFESLPWRKFSGNSIIQIILSYIMKTQMSNIIWLRLQQCDTDSLLLKWPWIQFNVYIAYSSDFSEIKLKVV